MKPFSARRMISIRKYLNLPGSDSSVTPDVYSAEALLRFSAAVLDGIQRHVLTDAADEQRRRQVSEVKEALGAEWHPEEASLAAHTICRLLGEYSSRSRETALNQTIEMQHIFAMLNQALIVLAQGKDQSVARLNKIQDSLQRTSMIGDIVALKASLAETVRFVKQESERAGEEVTEELGKFEREVSKVREFLGNSRIELAGRPEALVTISEYSAQQAPGVLCVLAYVCDRLHAVTQRYGPAVADELTFRLIKERIQPVAPVNTIYRWTPVSLVAVFRHGGDVTTLRAKVGELNRTRLLHQITLGNRTAALTLSPSHLMAEDPSGEADVLIEQVDRFTGAMR